MKVIFNAREQSDWKYECDCMGCSSKLEITASDLSFVADSRDGNAYTFVCPVCKRQNWINAKLVPQGIVAR